MTTGIMDKMYNRICLISILMESRMRWSHQERNKRFKEEINLSILFIPSSIFIVTDSLIEFMNQIPKYLILEGFQWKPVESKKCLRHS